MGILLILLSTIALVFGLLILSEATTGVGMIGIAGVLAIYTRLAQSAVQHREIKRMFGERPPEKPLTTRERHRMLAEREAKKSDNA